MKKIYLAIPYTDMKEESFKLSTTIAAKLMETLDFNVYSPITHCHPMTLIEGVKLPGNWGFWEIIDHQYIDWCDEIYVVIPNDDFKLVQNSTGVQAEIAYGAKLGKPVKFIKLNSVGKIVDTVIQPNL